MFQIFEWPTAYSEHRSVGTLVRYIRISGCVVLGWLNGWTIKSRPLLGPVNPLSHSLMMMMMMGLFNLTIPILISHLTLIDGPTVGEKVRRFSCPNRLILYTAHSRVSRFSQKRHMGTGECWVSKTNLL